MWSASLKLSVAVIMQHGDGTAVILDMSPIL